MIDYFSSTMNVNFYRTTQTSSNIKLTYSGTWLRYQSGLKIITQRIQFNNVNCYFSWGSIFTNAQDIRKLPNFAQSFSIALSANMTLQTVVSPGGTDCWLVISTIGGIISTTNPGGFQIARGSANNACNITVNVIGVGRWK